MQNATPSILQIVALAAALALLILMFLKSWTAKTRKAFWIYSAIGAWGGFGLLAISGLVGVELFVQQVRAMPWEVFAAGAIFFIGGNYFVLRSRHQSR